MGEVRLTCRVVVGAGSPAGLEVATGLDRVGPGVTAVRDARAEPPSPTVGAALDGAEVGRLHRLGALPATDPSSVVHPWVVGPDRPRAAGWRPLDDDATCLGLLPAEVRGHRADGARRLGRRDAAPGAGGAAAAVASTAPLWRRPRARHRRCPSRPAGGRP